MPNLLMSPCGTSEKLFFCGWKPKSCEFRYAAVKRGTHQRTSTAEQHFFDNSDDLQYRFDIGLAFGSELSYLFHELADAQLHCLRLGVVLCGVFMRRLVRLCPGRWGHGFEVMVVKVKVAAGSLECITSYVTFTPCEEVPHGAIMVGLPEQKS